MLSKIVTRLLPLLLFFIFHAGSASAQQGDRAPNLNLGDAVVAGFAGTLPPAPGRPIPRGKSASDLTFINPDGPSVRVIEVSRPGYVWDGRLFAAPKKFDVLARDVGQVFGVALDDQTPPNIYVAATSLFGLNIVNRGRDGLPERRRKGGPGAGWMKGQFGLDLQGGPGAIYKIDGRTGVATLFANVTLDGVPNPGAGLGNLAYDAAHKQLFVSDLYTGMIHRFDLDGKELGVYDHGVTGLGAAKLATVAFNPKNRPHIASDRFDSEKPDTWGFAPAVRRVWGLALHEGRLYYSVVSGPQIWSVGIERDGSFAADPRWELDVPAQAGPLPVSDIAFSQKGAMILAQRGLIAGAYDYSAFIRPGEPQVFRIWLKGPNDPPSPGRWKLVPEEYAVGFAGNFRNTNGGVALGYGYGADGTLKPEACEFSLWTTAQNIRNAPALKSRLDPGGPLVVHGLAGVPASPVRTFNEPPWTSYAVDYDDAFREPHAAGHLGSVRIYSQPCAAPAVYSGPGYPASPPYIAGVTIVTPGPCIGSDCPPPPSGTPFDLGIAKIGEYSPNNPYGPYNFTLGVTNLGPAITGPQTITVTDVVPAGMTFTNVTSSNWTCTPLPGPPIAAGGTLTCTYTGTFPIAANQTLGWVTIVATGGAGPYLNCANLGEPDSNLSNNQACIPVQKTGELAVEKVVVSHLMGNTIPSANYTVNVTCGGNTTTLSLPSNGTPQTVSNIPYGTLCTVVEPPPPVPPNLCPLGTTGVWTIAYAPPQPVPPIVINAVTTTVTVTNTFDCVKDGDGSFTVKKEVINNTSIPVPASSVYAISASCVSGMSPAVVTAMPLTNGGSQTLNPLALNTVCTITETPPIPPSTGAVSCGAPGSTLVWTTVLPAPVTITGPGMTATVQNILDCIPSGGGDNGYLLVGKVIDNQTNDHSSAYQTVLNALVFPVTATCDGNNTPLTISQGTPGVIVHAVPVGQLCSVMEGTLPPPPTTGCASGSVPTWVTPPTYTGSPPGIPVTMTTGAGPTITVTNTLICAPPVPTANFRVIKVVNNNTQAVLTGMTFPVTATCGGNATALNLTANVPKFVYNLPVGTVCWVVETTPLPALPTTGCTKAGDVPTWVTPPTYFPASIPITAGFLVPTITVTNTVNCVPGGQVGTVVVNKTVNNLTTADLTGMTYPATATCGGVATPLNLSVSGSQTVTNAPAGANCMVNEPLPQGPTTGCPGMQVPLWLPPVYNPPNVTVPSSGTATITVENTLRCERSGYIAVLKTITNNTSADVSGISFPVTVTCNANGGTYTFSNSVNATLAGAQVINNVAPDYTCTPVETLPSAPMTGCPAGSVPTWGNPVYVPPSVVTSYGVGGIITVQNTLNCTPSGGGGNGSLIVNKTVINNTNGQVSTAGLSYPVNATCGGVPTYLPLTESAPGTVSNLALGTNCSVQEGAYPTVTCPTDYVPSWSTAYLPSASVIVIAAGTPVTVQNTLDCKIIAAVRVAKHVINNTQAVISGLSYPMTVSCVTGTMPATTFPITVPGESSQTVHNIAGGSACTVSETPPAPPTTGCTGGMVPTWVTPPLYNPPSVTASSGAGAPIMVTNTLNCAPPHSGFAPPQNCTPPQIPNPSGAGCLCPSGTTPAGKGCVTPATCQPPKVPGPIAGQCVCRPGTVPSGKDCVKPTTCISPAKSNGRGGCDCPEGMTKRGNNKCVKKEQPKLNVTPSDVINGIGIIRGLGGGGGGGGPSKGGGGTLGKP